MIGVELKERATPTRRALRERGVRALPAGTLTPRLPPPVRKRVQADDPREGMAAVME